jgi:hypothetical protein
VCKSGACAAGEYSGAGGSHVEHALTHSRKCSMRPLGLDSTWTLDTTKRAPAVVRDRGGRSNCSHAQNLAPFGMAPSAPPTATAGGAAEGMMVDASCAAVEARNQLVITREQLDLVAKTTRLRQEQGESNANAEGTGRRRAKSQKSQLAQNATGRAGSKGLRHFAMQVRPCKRDAMPCTPPPRAPRTACHHATRSRARERVVSG